MTQLSRRKWGRSALIAAASTLAIAAATPSIAAQEPAANATQQDINIPPGQLDDALITVSEIYGVTVIAPSNLVRGLTSPAISGSVNAEQAITALLQDSRLTVSQSPSGAFIVAKAAEEEAAINPVLQETVQQDTSPEPLVADTVVVQGRFQNSLINRLPIDPQDLPFSVDTVDKSFIEERGFLTPYESLQTLPNVSIQGTLAVPTGPAYFVRGFLASELTNNRPESLSEGAGRRDSSFVERIEVAKGPTSILLGPVIPGGAINVVTKSPNNEDSLNVAVRGGSFDTYRGEFDINSGRLIGSDQLRGRITLAYEDRGSPQDGVNLETLAVRPVVEWDISDRTIAQASIAYTRREGNQESLFPLNSDGSIPEGFTPETVIGIPGPIKGKDLYYDAELQHEFLDNLKLTVRGSYQETDFEYNNSQSGYNYTGSSYGFEPGDPLAYIYLGRGTSDETVAYGDVQLAGNFNAFGQRQDWVVGSSYQSTELFSTFGFDSVFGVVDITNFEAAVFPEPNFDFPSEPFFIQENELYSLYAEANLRPSDRFTIVAGARYDELEAVDIDPTADDSFGDGSFESKFDDVTFRIGASYALSEPVNVYASFAESFIPQGGTLRNGDLVGPETATNYEIGLKGSFFDNRVSVQAASFFLTRRNVATADPTNIRGEEFFVIAAGEQEHKGFELNGRFSVTDALSFDLSYGFVDAEITESNNEPGPFSLFVEGDPVTVVPKHTFNVFGTYEIQDGPLADLKIGLGARGVSERPAPASNVNYDGYTIVDASLSYPISDRFQAQLNVLNLLDEEYLDYLGGAFGLTSSQSSFGDPRGIFVTLKATF